MIRTHPRSLAILAALAITTSALAATGCGSDSSTDNGHNSMGMGRTGTVNHASTVGSATTMGQDEHTVTGSGMDMSSGGTVDGLASRADGYRLVASRAALPMGRATAFTFRITDRNGMAVTEFGLDQTKRMHLIVASRDLSQYQHVHPTMSKDGTWSVPLTLPQRGDYRVFADFNAGGSRHVLGRSIMAPGTMIGMALPKVSTTARTDGYLVTTKHGPLAVDRTHRVTFTVTRAGRPVTDLQPYLGTLGHLVVLREGTLE